MPITSTEQFASGRYVNYGSPSALDDMATLTIVAYAKKTGTGGSNLGYYATKYTPGNGGWRFLVEHNSGSPRIVFGWDSTGVANNPSKTGGSGEIVDNTWQHAWATATRSLLSSDINLYIEGTECVYSNATNGSGSLISDAENDGTNDLFIGNRGPSGTLGRNFDGDIAYVAIWNRILNSTERSNVNTNGPLAEPSGLVFCFANDQDYSSNAYTQTARSSRVTGSTPTNTALGDGNSPSPGVGAIVVTGYAPTASVANGSATATPSAGAVVITGRAPTAQLSNSLVAAPAAASGVISGNAPTVVLGSNPIIVPGVGSASFTGRVPTIVRTGDFVTDEPLINNTGSEIASTLVHYSYYVDGRIGSLSGKTLVEGSRNTESDGYFKLPGRTLGEAGLALISSRNNDATDDHAAYYAGSVV